MTQKREILNPAPEKDIIIPVFQGFEQKQLMFVQFETSKLVRPVSHMSHFCPKIRRHKHYFEALNKNFYAF